MITLHKATSIDFLQNNGLGILKDCISAEVIEEINGEFSLTLEYPKNGNLYSQITEEKIIVSNVGYGNRQAFRITNIDETLISKKVYAIHIFYDLADNLLEDIYPQNLSGNNAIKYILERTQFKHNFIGSSNIEKSSAARYVRKNIVQALISDDDNSFVNRWGGEIIRDNFSINMVEKRQSTITKKTVRYRKNLKGLNFVIDYSTIATRIMPKGYDGLLLPEKYVDSPLINKYAHPKIKILDYEEVKIKTQESEEEGFDTEEEAYEELRKLALQDIEKGIDKPTLTTTIDFIKLSDVKEYEKYKNLENLYIGDTISVQVEEIDIEIEQRIVKTTYNPLNDKFTKYELGNVKNNYAIQNVKSDKKLQETILPNILQQAKSNATTQLTKALGGYIYKTQNELFIMDTDNPNTAQKVWRWNLNGLGYSSTGINGEYGIAMTQDGQIVADFITTGTMSVSRIEGLSNSLNNIYNSISLNQENTVLEIKNLSDKFNLEISELEVAIDAINQIVQSTVIYKREIEGTTEVHITDAGNVNALRLEISGIKTYEANLFPKTNLYPRANLTPNQRGG